MSKSALGAHAVGTANRALWQVEISKIFAPLTIEKIIGMADGIDGDSKDVNPLHRDDLEAARQNFASGMILPGTALITWAAAMVSAKISCVVFSAMQISFRGDLHVGSVPRINIVISGKGNARLARVSVDVIDLADNRIVAKGEGVVRMPVDWHYE
ncbi:MAG: hypothetical protein WAN50_02385 [Minisyncoccia bacterium]